MASGPITSWQITKQWKKWQTLFLEALKSLLMVTAAMKLKDACSLEEKLWPTSVQFSSDAQSCPILCDPMIATGQATLFITNSQSYSNSCPLSWWCHPTIASSVVPFSSCFQSFSASGSFPVSQLFTWGGQSTEVSASTSVLPVNTQDWSPLGWTGWISLQSKGLSRVFSNTTVQKHKFFGAKMSLAQNIIESMKKWR